MYFLLQKSELAETFEDSDHFDQHPVIRTQLITVGVVVAQDMEEARKRTGLDVHMDDCTTPQEILRTKELLLAGN